LLVAALGARGAETSLSFGFLDEPPGTLVALERGRLHLECRGGGSGPATVLFEAGLGGSAFEWQPVEERLPEAVRLCHYDRAGYGWSDPVWHRRDARALAGELDALLEAAALEPPFVLVAHSFGGFVARLLAARRAEDIAALVLVDTSHEEQFTRLASPGGKRMLPRGGTFVMSQAEAPEGLPAALERKVTALGRLRKTYAATYGEMASFLESAEQVGAARTARDGPFPFPVVVIRRGRDLYADSGAVGKSKTAAWAALQEDLATLGTEGRVVVAESSGHHVHVDDPDLVAREIARVLEALERGRAAPARSSDAPLTAGEDDLGGR